MTAVDYKPGGETLRQFMLDDTFCRGVRGPIGSGKSVTCCIEMFRRACEQAPDEKGRRRSRWAAIRNTFPELKDTTIKTWLDWFPEAEFGKMSWTPPFRHKINLPLPDKTTMELEVIFLALDRDEDVKKLLSLELTGAWINEAREIGKAIVDGATSRVGRFPSIKDGGPTWYGVIMDTNSMPEDHWWPIMSGESEPPEWMDEDDLITFRKPSNWKFFTQPPAMYDKVDSNKKLIGYEYNEDRENAKYLVPGYYDNLVQGKTREWIKVYVQNKVGSITEGKVVYPEFREETHMANAATDYIKGKPVFIGVDFGLTPAAIFGQQLNGRIIIHRELTSRDMGARRFGQQLLISMAEWFPHCSDFRLYGDPAGDDRAQTDETTPFQIFNALGIKIMAAPSNDPIIRTEAVKMALNTMIDGNAGFVLSTLCPILKAGFMRGYHYRKVQVSGGAHRYVDKPDKGQYSHPHDALQYLALGMGLGRALVTGANTGRATVIPKRGDLWSRHQSTARKRPNNLLGQRY
ncbi:MAG: hypothetical protein JKY34_08735 [Kordiimonadaceae bacterium]|nr:hypothetical protein [Kordiimonadaceae bacterium]